MDGKRTIETMKMAAIRAGMDARLDVMDVGQLAERKLPVILYAMNDFGKYEELCRIRSIAKIEKVTSCLNL